MRFGRNSLPGYLLAGIIGIGMTGWSGYTLYQGGRSSDWPSVQGTITQADVEIRTGTRRQQNTRHREAHREYREAVAYTYTVNGVDYTASRISFWDYYYETEQLARDALVTYPVGGGVTVYYDPSTPGEAVLHPGNEDYNALPLIAGVVMLIAGMVGTWFKLARG